MASAAALNANGDGVLNKADLTLVVGMVHRPGLFNAAAAKRADMNGDGVFNYQDEGLLSQRIRQRGALGPSGPRGQSAGPEVFYIHFDHIDAPRVIVDADNTVRWRWDQVDPFGVQPADESPQNDFIALPFNLRFPGQYYDQETGLHYNGHRDYDPSTGRYIESDPIGLAGGSNLYAYAAANPVDIFDTFGLQQSPRRVARATSAELFETQYGTGLTTELLFREIQRIDPGFRYPATVSRLNSGPGQGDLIYLGRVLEGYRTQAPRVYARCSSTDPEGGNYLLRDPISGDILYAGRTNDVARREYEYSRSAWRDLVFGEAARTDSYSQQRGIEEVLFNRYSPPLNTIRPISPANPRLQFYLDTAGPFLF